ncbi:type I restriction endonuclease, partial [Dehalobacter sp. UNSWDHB]|uniref:type I restriction endonuclease n=2 Tax=unclassified Dehalobacter TaxID=2635733 RepID=UPI0005568805
MDFIDELKQFALRVENLREKITTEEATKNSLILPFFQMLGYDIFDPSEVVPEFTADVGIKKGEKVDYAIFQNGTPIILVEAKWCGEKLDKHGSQLFRYFGTTKAKFGILTNGIIYQFFTDLEEPNKMDEKPFMELNLL